MKKQLDGLQAQLKQILGTKSRLEHQIDSLAFDEVYNSATEDEAAKIMGENAKVTYFDASLFKQIAGERKSPISEPGVDIEIAIKISAELLKHDKSMVREYQIIRLHKDAAQKSFIDVITGEFREATGEFVFKCDKLSTFAIAYNDAPKAAEDNTPDDSNTPDTAGTSAPKPGDAANLVLWMLVLMSAVLSLAQMHTKKNVH